MNPENILEESPDIDTFGGRFSRALDVCKLDTDQFARRICVMPETVRGWENDRAMPNFHRMDKIAGLLGVSIAWLLHGVGKGPADMTPETPEDMEKQLSQLKFLHAQTGQLISRLQLDLDRLATAGH